MLRTTSGALYLPLLHQALEVRCVMPSPAVTKNASGLPLPSMRRCSFVEKPPRERPSASLCCPLLRPLRAGEREQPYYRRSERTSLSRRWHRLVVATSLALRPIRPLCASDRSEKQPSPTSRSVRAGLATAHPYGSPIGCR